MPGHPSFVSTSLWHTRKACTLMSTCPAPGLGISRSTISKSAPALEICAAFIGAIATLVVAMNPPTDIELLLKSTYRYGRGDRILLAAPRKCVLKSQREGAKDAAETLP